MAGPREVPDPSPPATRPARVAGATSVWATSPVSTWAVMSGATGAGAGLASENGTSAPNSDTPFARPTATKKRDCPVAGSLSTTRDGDETGFSAPGWSDSGA